MLAPSTPTVPVRQTVALASVCVVLTHCGNVLWAVRPAGKPLAGALEIPGGKAEHGEQPEDTARREIREELDIECGQFRYLATLGVPSYRSPAEWYFQTAYQAVPSGLTPGPNAETKLVVWLPAGQVPADATPASRLLVGTLDWGPFR